MYKSTLLRCTHLGNYHVFEGEEGVSRYFLTRSRVPVCRNLHPFMANESVFFFIVEYFFVCVLVLFLDSYAENSMGTQALVYMRFEKKVDADYVLPCEFDCGTEGVEGERKLRQKYEKEVFVRGLAKVGSISAEVEGYENYSVRWETLEMVRVGSDIIADLNERQVIQ